MGTLTVDDDRRIQSMVIAAIDNIRTVEAEGFDVIEKEGRGGARDIFTTADTTTQELYVAFILKHFPGFGIIAEELGLRQPCARRDIEAHFTIDPLDGTRAFERVHSFGVATMISLVVNDQVVCAYVGDVNTGEIYGYGSSTDGVIRIRHGRVLRLGVKHGERPLDARHLLLRDRLEAHAPAVQRMAAVCRSYEITSGSIGVSMSRVWKDEVGAHVTKRELADTPWDTTPLIGISKMLGLWHLVALPDGSVYPFDPVLPRERVENVGDIIVTHARYVDALLAAAQL